MIVDKKISEITAMLQENKISSVELAEEYIKKVETNEEKINAFITFNKEDVIELAKKSDERRNNGKPLSIYDGIPIAIKDNISTKGIRTTCGSKFLENYVPPFDANVYEKIKSNGLINIGKTNMDEFAMGSTTETSYFGSTKNPFNTDCVPGGSSGGSAAAVSANMVPAALGSDTGGSIRQPAAFCGVVGVKPTYGRVSRYGLVAFASSLDQIGTFAQNVDDVANMLSLISGWDKRDSTSVDMPVDFQSENLKDDISGMVVGVPEEYFKSINSEIGDLIKDKISLLEKEGAVIKKISLTYTDYAIPVYYLIATAEASSNLARYDGVRYGYRSPNVKDLSSLYQTTRSEGFGKEVKRRIILGTYSLSSGYYDAYYLQALKGRKLIIDNFKKSFEDVDVIITPTTTSTAFKIGEMVSDPLQMYMSDILTISANLAGIPGISVPVGLASNGMPVGLQIMGNHFNEKGMFEIAKAVERNSDEIKANL